MLFLCRRKCTLAEADVIFESLLTELKTYENETSRFLREFLYSRIAMRRNLMLSGLIRYLFEGSGFRKSHLLEYPVQEDLLSFAVDIFTKLFLKTSEESLSLEESFIDHVEHHNNQSYTTKLENLIFGPKKAKITKFISKDSPKETIRSYLKNEIKVFDSSGVLPDALRKIREALSSITPTSVESERAFSALGLFVTKMRSSLDDDSIDQL